MIYLFTNRVGGMGFITRFAAFCAHNRCAGTVVLSSSNWQGLPWHLHAWQVMGHRMTAWRLSRPPFLSVRVVGNVNAEAFIRSIQPDDHGIVGGFDQIFKGGLIDRFDSLVNLHTSLLPCYRGPIPTWWVLENGETSTGYTLHRVTEKIDAGEILYQQVLEINPGETEPELRDRLWQAGQSTLDAWLEHLVRGREFARRVVDATEVYRVKADYCGYPDG